MDYFDNKLISFLAAPFVAIMVLFFAESYMSFKPKLLPAENQLYRFSHKPVKFSVRNEPIVVKGFLKSPIGVNEKKNAETLPIEVGKEAGEEKPAIVEKKVSFILINKTKKMAIINGFVLHEGDVLASSMVLKIESDRVLIKEAGAAKRWLEME